MIKREYTQGYTHTEPLEGDIPEPTYAPPNLDDFEEEEAEEAQLGKTEAEERPPLNPAYNELGKKEKEMGADAMCEVAIDGYSKLCGLLGNVAVVSDKKLDKEFAEGNIDPKTLLPLDSYGNTANVKEFFAAYNEEAKAAFEVSDEFKENIKPPLKRVFMKRGVALTDENLIVYYVVTDLGTKIYSATQLLSTNKQILEGLREQNMHSRAQSAPEPKPSQPSSEAKPQEPVHEEFTEHGEEQETQSDTIIMDDDLIVESAKGFKESPVHTKMQEFGNEELLADMQKLADREAVKQKTKKTKK